MGAQRRDQQHMDGSRRQPAPMEAILGAVSNSLSETLYFSARTDDAGSEVWRMAMEHMVFYG